MTYAQRVVDFAKWFKRALAEREWTQEYAAREIGVSLSTVSRWIHGRGTPRYAELWAIYEALGELPFDEK